MIQIFAEEPFGLLSRAAGLATQLTLERVKRRAKRR
jgi:hypothetical protein